MRIATPHLPVHRLQARVRHVALAGLALCAGSAHAVIVLLATGSPRQITMRIGSSTIGTISTVTFDVQNANTSPTPVAVTGVPSAGSSAAGTTPAGSTTISVLTRNGNNSPLQVTADSAAGLSCTAGSGCGSTIIPFNTISWTSYNLDTTYAGADFQSGTFNGSSSQLLINVNLVNVSVRIENQLIFSYNNSTLYPAGKYVGRVAYTATLL